ncbi:hypothetical protein ACFFX0_24205 [Citricoccus parietis]|uniref:Uncharacterized protein n=1 Tax=Citricoccus parietis TaxID=592307 RepID=A0ABV5G5C6_9MICC
MRWRRPGRGPAAEPLRTTPHLTHHTSPPSPHPSPEGRNAP